MNNTVLGTPNTNVILETASKLYVKSGDRYYEIDFRNLSGNGSSKSSSTKSTSTVNETEESEEIVPVVNTTTSNTGNYVTVDQLLAKLKKYTTKREWKDVVETTEMLKEAQLEDGFTESIKPITIQTMQLVVGSDQLQFEFVASRTSGSVVAHKFYIDESSKGGKGMLWLPEGIVKHYTLDGPDNINPTNDADTATSLAKDYKYTDYQRWELTGGSAQGWRTNPETGDLECGLEFPTTDEHYLYLYVPNYQTITAKYSDDEKYVDWNNAYAKRTADWDYPRFILSPVSVSLNGVAAKEYDYTTYSDLYNIVGSPENPNATLFADNKHYMILYATFNTADAAGNRSWTTMNGYTEITPGQITAWTFKAPDGDCWLDLKEPSFLLGDEVFDPYQTTHVFTLNSKYTEDQLPSVGDILTCLDTTGASLQVTYSGVEKNIDQSTSGTVICGVSAWDVGSGRRYPAATGTLSNSSGSWAYGSVKNSTSGKGFLYYDPKEGLIVRGTLQVVGNNGTLINVSEITGLLDDFKRATDESTLISGGLILTSLIAVGYTDSSSKYHVTAGLNGIPKDSTGAIDTTKIALWTGGDMIDRDHLTKGQTVDQAAKCVIRHDGTGYLSGGNVWWDSNGRFYANALRNNFKDLTDYNTDPTTNAQEWATYDNIRINVANTGKLPTTDDNIGRTLHVYCGNSPYTTLNISGPPIMIGGASVWTISFPVNTQITLFGYGYGSGSYATLSSWIITDVKNMGTDYNSSGLTLPSIVKGFAGYVGSNKWLAKYTDLYGRYRTSNDASAPLIITQKYEDETYGMTITLDRTHFKLNGSLYNIGTSVTSCARGGEKWSDLPLTATIVNREYSSAGLSFTVVLVDDENCRDKLPYKTDGTMGFTFEVFNVNCFNWS